MRFLVRILIVLVLAFLLKGFLIPESQAYISLPETKSWVEQIEREAMQIRRAAQDLPASIEVVIRRLFGEVKPQIEAKSV